MATIHITVSPDMIENGYQPKTTFWMDFSIADKFGIAAIKDTYNRAFKEWKTNHMFNPAKRNVSVLQNEMLFFSAKRNVLK